MVKNFLKKLGEKEKKFVKSLEKKEKGLVKKVAKKFHSLSPETQSLILTGGLADVSVLSSAVTTGSPVEVPAGAGTLVAVEKEKLERVV